MHSPLPVAGVGAPAGRITGIDAARGIAMVLVCLSHVRIHFEDAAPALYDLLTTVTRLATPSFLLLSGFVAAHVLGQGGRLERATLIDRGLFLLLVAHVLIGLADLRTLTLSEWLFARVLVTDAIGVCLLVAVFAHTLAARTLFTLGVVVMLSSWVVAMTATPDDQFAQHLGAVLFNLHSAPNPYVNAPLAPYLGLFLLGMSLRKSSARYVRAGDFEALARKCLLIGAVAVGAAALGIAVWYLTKPLTAQWAQDSLDLLRATLDPRKKLPPSPAYFLAYAGGGALFAGLCLQRRPRLVMEPIVTRAAVIGRASLMCFILQDWLLRLAPHLLGFDAIESPAFWLPYFAATALVLYWCSRGWLAMRGNRFLTLGIKKLATPRDRSTATPARQP